MKILNLVLLILLPFLTFANAGQIDWVQSENCDTTMIFSIEDAVNDSCGAIEYVWMASCGTGYYEEIAVTSEPNLNVTDDLCLINDSYFIRCARCVGETQIFGETDPIFVPKCFPAMPVELTVFNGKEKKNNIELDIVFESIVDYSHTEIIWNGITIDSIDGGKMTEGELFTFVHQNPTFGDNYYQLKMVDLDGSHEISKLINVYYNNDNHITLSQVDTGIYEFVIPNVDQMLGLQYQLVTINGQVIYRGYGWFTSDSKFKVDLTTYPANWYVFIIYSQSGSTSFMLHN